jgi:Protein of unknown function (DUF4242)
VQDQENADFKQAWGDPETGIVFCLSGAPSKEVSCETYERAGHPTDEVYEITGQPNLGRAEPPYPGSIPDQARSPAPPGRGLH